MKKHIFLVDDDKDEMLFFAEALKRVPISSKCTWAQNGDQALKQLRYISPDIIFVDLCMPDMDGLKCLEVIRSIPRLEHTPVILHSSALSADSRTRALAIGATACFDKPDSLQEMANLLTSFLVTKTETVAT